MYILRELSRRIPNLWIRVFDNDGEFLLVEAAKVLPNWLSPEIELQPSMDSWVPIIHHPSERRARRRRTQASFGRQGSRVPQTAA